jgi:hypothetical protein
VPITIVVPTPDNVVGPGLVVQWSSDFIGPLPSGTILLTQISDDPEFLNVDRSTRLVVNSPQGAVELLTAPTGINATGGIRSWDEGRQVHVQMQLFDPAHPQTPIDSGTLTTTWSSTVSLQTLIQREAGNQGGGGLTDQQAQQLAETHLATVPALNIDALTTINLTPGGPSAGPINSALPDTTFGFIVRIANVPIDLLPQTPDGDYWYPTVAVARLFRGSDLYHRWPIHTSSKMVSFYDESPVIALATSIGAEWALQLSLQVDFLDGVTGSVLLLRFP